MKVYDLILQLIEYMKDYGNQEVVISILTDNGNYEFEPCVSGAAYPESYQIEMDVEDVRAFKKTIK